MLTDVFEMSGQVGQCRPPNVPFVLQQVLKQRERSDRNIRGGTTIIRSDGLTQLAGGLI
jgi:hypothetical protein